MSGPHAPSDVPEFAPIAAAVVRGSKRSNLRRLAVVCPGPKAHTLLEVFPADGSHLLFTERWLHALQGEAFRHSLMNERVVVEGNERLGTETIPVAATLEDSPKVWWVICCMIAGIETSWVSEQLEGEKRRAVVPDFQLPRDTL